MATETEMLESIVSSIGDIQSKVKRAEEGSARVEELKGRKLTGKIYMEDRKGRAKQAVRCWN